ncbi:amino acid adenylation domain-containing protein [Bacillus bombysepticus]
MLDKFTQQVLLSSEKFKKEKEYWLDKLSGDVELSRFPCDCLSLNNIQVSKESYYCQFPSDIAKRAVAISNNSDMLLYTILLSGVKYLLSRYTDKDDVVIGMPVFKQGQEETVFQNNFLLLRTQINQEDNFKEIIYKIKETILESNEHCHFPFNKLTQLLSLDGESNNLPLLNTIVMLDDIHCYESTDKINSDMVIRFMKNEEQLKVQVDYNSTLYSEGLVSRIVNHLYNILDILMKDPNKSAMDLDVMSKTEKNQILYDFNHTTRVHKTLLCETVTAPQLFEEQVKQNPNQIAIVCNEKEITYKQLNIKANQLARRLLDQGVKRESIVGVMMERSIEMIVGILGILKTGGAYLPIDTDLPKQRVEYMLTDSGCSHVLTYQNSIIKGVAFQGSVINLMDIPFEEEQVEDLQITMEPHNLAYVIYTSGSTGQPKGVMIEHRSLTNFLCAMYEDFSQDIGITDNVLFSSSISFDVTIFEIFVPLVYGARMTIYKGEKFDVPKLVQVILEEQVTLAYIPPTLLNEIYDYFVRANQKILLNKLFVGVEPIKTKLLAKYDHLFEGNLQILNLYGPTEATVCCTSYQYETDKEITTQNVPIGSPLLNTKIYILDSFHRIQPIGVPGEICISGIGLARGYINRKELTADKFIDHPFEPGEKLYKTGDIARWLPDGNIEYLGRVDHQVKIRGYRIELGEIEASLLKYETIKTAVVMQREDESGEKYLCAYVVTEKDIPIPEVRAYLATKLPYYMIPQQIIPIQNIPLTQNGKIDRKKLPQPTYNLKSSHIEPTNSTERKLVEIWKEVLGIQRVGIQDNFFEIGGHSLKAAKLISIVNKEFNVQLSIKSLFKFPVLVDFSKCILEMEKSDYISIEPVKQQEYYLASTSQKRMFIVDQFEDGTNTTYNMPTILKVEGDICKDKFENIFQSLIQRHEILRTSFQILDGELVQKIEPNVEFNIEYVHVYEKDVDYLIHEFISPFDLSKAPLLRVLLLRIAEERHILLVDMHHIISDGLSMGILIKEFVELYKGNELPKLRVQYKDFVMWQNGPYYKNLISEQKNYWLTTLKGELPVLNFPTDFQRPTIQSFKGKVCSFNLGTDLTFKVNKLATETGTTPYMILLAIYNILLSRYTGQEDIIVGSPIAGRSHSDTNHMIGMFINTLVMRNYLENDDEFIEFLSRLKLNTLEAYENQDYPFEEVLEDLDLHRDTSRNPLFDTMFVFQNMDMNPISIGELEFTPYPFKQSVSKFDLSLIATEIDNNIHLKVEYSTKLFKAETIERLMVHFTNIVEEVTNNPRVRLRNINMLSVEEEHCIMNEFNKKVNSNSNHLLVHKMFEEQVKRNPNQIAVVCNEKGITYNKLNIKANQLARRLLDQGVKRETIVGVMMERSIEMVIGILGVLKAGGAYLPIDTDLPKRRVEYMLTDSGCSHVLVHQNSIIKGIEFQGNVIDLMDMSFEEEPGEDMQMMIEPHNLAYVIYTSGSTGQPKGVMIEHRSLTNFLCAMYEDFSQDIGITDNVLFSSSISFDVTIFEIFVPLIYGARMTIYQGEKFDVSKLVQVILEEQVTLSYIPPTLLNEIYDYFVRDNQKIVLNKLLVGVEPIKTELLAKYDHLFRGNLQILNGYGPTEATVCCTSYRYESDKEITTQNVPIGSPLLNTKIYILDSFHRIQPIGVPGEICISGIGLARGYINRKELTADKFIDHPFELSEKLYKTGDIARWLPDGNIEYLGRVDHQVKIRGYRIELGEIEASLLKYETIKTAVVIDQEDEAGEKYLCAYVVTEKDIPIPEVRAYLATKLPHYMIPQQLIPIHNIPLTQNGKIDRSKLPKLNTLGNSNYVPPRNEIDSSLIDIWSSILGVNNIGINDNFFELGGHSLKGLKLFENIKRMFNVQLPLSLLFQKATIEQLSDVISRNKGIDSECLIPIQNGTNKDSQWFIVHGQGGGILNYYDLARELGEDKTVYGLQSIGYDDSRFPNLSVEEMAVRYIEEIKQVKKEGPYTLLGWSFGGIVAFEMARKLEKLGDKVSFLGLLDVHPIEQGKEILSLNIKNAFEELEKFNDQLGIEKISFEQMSEEQLIESLLKKFTLNENSCQQNFEDPMMNKLKVMIANRYAYLKYNCKQKIKADIFLFNASINDIHPLVDYNRWNEYTLGEVYALQVPGSHLSMLEKPHIHELVKSIKMSFKQMLLLAHVNK